MTVQAHIQEKIFTEAFLFWPSDHAFAQVLRGGVLERVPPENV